MNRVYLFSLPELLTEQNLSSIEIKGLAEWSDHTPALFLLLVGPDPAMCTWAVYTDGNHPPAFVCDWTEAAARVDRLCELAAPHPHLATALGPIRALLHTQANRHLVLHVAELAIPQHGRQYERQGFKAFMAALAARANALATELGAAIAAGAIGPAQPTLARMAAAPAARQAAELGYWDPRIEEGYWLDHDEPAEIPDFLREFDGYWYSNNRSGLSFDRKLGAYEVRSKKRRKSPARYGIATAYGRWLLPMGDLQPHTNRYDDEATRSWIVVARDLDPANRGGESDKCCYGLLDANGQEVLPLEYEWLHTVGDKLVIYRHLAERSAGSPGHRLMRIDTGEVLPSAFDSQVRSHRGDGYIEMGLQGSATESARRGLIDFDGRPVTEFVYQGFSTFHKRNKVAIAVQDGKCGLINTEGKVILPMVYDRIAQNTSDGPPHFHGDSTLIFTAEFDERGTRIHRSERVGVADRHGRVLAEPAVEPWHLQWTFDKRGAMLVHRDDVLYWLFADGSLSGPVGSFSETIEEMRRSFSHRSALQDGSARRPSELVAELDREACLELIDILCRQVMEQHDALREEFDELVASASQEHGETAGDDGEGNDEDEDHEATLHVQPGDSPATPFFRVLAYAFRDARLWMHLDWKAVDEISHAAAHMPDLVALETFTWDGVENGEGMEEGFDALDEHLGRHGFRLIQYRTDGDDYMVGAVAAAKLERCIELAQGLGVPLLAPSGS